MALSVITATFFLAYFNRFAGLRSGAGEYTTGIWFLHGQLPYRDYFSATPPLNTLKSALLLKVFGPFLVVSRAAGVVERLLIGIVLFKWLGRTFSTPFAFAGSLVAMILSAGDVVDPLASYNHDAIFWATLSGFAASHLLPDTEDRSAGLWAIVSGFAAGLCLITKQTVGIGAVFAVPAFVAALLLNCKAYRRATIWLGGFLAGSALPVLLLALWLHHLHAWRTFLTMAFLKGPAAKGGNPVDFLRREVLVAESNWFLVVLACIAIVLAASAIYRAQGEQGEGRNRDLSAAAEMSSLAWLTCGFGCVIGVAELSAKIDLGTLHNLSKAAVYFVFLIVGWMVAAYSVTMFRKELSERQRQFALFAAVSFFVAFFLSLSWPAFEAMALPGLGFLVAAVLETTRPSRRRFLYALFAMLVFLQVREKLDVPFGFDSLAEAPVRLANQPSTLPALAGLRLSPDTNAFLEGTVRTIQLHAGPADTILTYPEMSLFYALSGRPYPTLAASHNVDVVNDSFAAEEANRILLRRPAVIVYMKLTPAEVAHQDEVWRFGRPSGQHILVAAIEELVSGYDVANVFRVGRDQREVVVYVRR